MIKQKKNKNFNQYLLGFVDKVVELRIETGGNTKTSQMALTQLRNIVKYSNCDFMNKIHEPLHFDDTFLKLTHLQRIYAETYDLSIGGGFKDKKNGRYVIVFVFF